MAAKISDLTRRHCRALHWFAPGRQAPPEEMPSASMLVSLRRRGLLQYNAHRSWTLTPAGLAVLEDWEAQR